jgi:hypothetical protein
LLVEMEREQESDGDGGFVLRRRGTVLGDRFGVIDGRTTIDPTFEFFRPHIERLKPGAHATVDTTVKTDAGVDDDGDGEWQAERRQRAIYCEEIQGELVNAYPSQTVADKKAKLDLISEVFQTRSWTKVESMRADVLRNGLMQIRTRLGVAGAPPADPFELDGEVDRDIQSAAAG